MFVVSAATSDELPAYFALFNAYDIAKNIGGIMSLEILEHVLLSRTIGSLVVYDKNFKRLAFNLLS